MIHAVHGEEHDRPRQHAPRREDETRGDDDDALGAGADADVAAQAERLGACARVRDEERPGDRGDGDGDEGGMMVPREDVRDRGRA